MVKQKNNRKIYKIWMTGVCMLAAGFCYSCGREAPEPAGKQEPYLETVGVAETDGMVEAGAGDAGLAASAGNDDQALNGGSVAESAALCYVHICGQVVNPGVYEIEAGSRIFQAVEAAGGLTDEADGAFLNMAEIFQDGMKISVPSVEEVENGTAVPGSGSYGAVVSGQGQSAKVNLNTASKEQLMTLRGIGESRAEDIIRYREEHGAFGAIEEIMEISGIKDAAFQKIKDDITV